MATLSPLGFVLEAWSSFRCQLDCPRICFCHKSHTLVLYQISLKNQWHPLLITYDSRTLPALFVNILQSRTLMGVQLKNVPKSQLVWPLYKCWFQADSQVVVGNTFSTRLITTLSFEFPTHGHDFQHANVLNHGREERWRLCRHPSCPTCLASPDSFVFYTDCFHILMEMAREQTQDQILGCGTGPLIHDTLWQVWLASH